MFRRTGVRFYSHVTGMSPKNHSRAAQADIKEMEHRAKTMMLHGDYSGSTSMMYTALAARLHSMTKHFSGGDSPHNDRVAANSAMLHSDRQTYTSFMKGYQTKPGFYPPGAAFNGKSGPHKKK